MASRKPPKRLFKNKDVIHTYQHDRENRTSMKHMTRDHLDVLQNIEFALVNCARKDPTIDDRVIDQALQVAMQQTDAGGSDPRVVMLCDLLDGMRAYRQEVPENIWHAGLRTVDDSVRRHSTLRPGEKSYLEFVKKYVV